jgi:hypothetical protein
MHAEPGRPAPNPAASRFPEQLRRLAAQADGAGTTSEPGLQTAAGRVPLPDLERRHAYRITDNDNLGRYSATPIYHAPAASLSVPDTFPADTSQQYGPPCDKAGPTPLVEVNGNPSVPNGAEVLAVPSPSSRAMLFSWVAPVRATVTAKTGANAYTLTLETGQTLTGVPEIAGREAKTTSKVNVYWSSVTGSLYFVMDQFTGRDPDGTRFVPGQLNADLANAQEVLGKKHFIDGEKFGQRPYTTYTVGGVSFGSVNNSVSVAGAQGIPANPADWAAGPVPDVAVYPAFTFVTSSSPVLNSGGSPDGSTTTKVSTANGLGCGRSANGLTFPAPDAGRYPMSHGLYQVQGTTLSVNGLSFFESASPLYTNGQFALGASGFYLTGGRVRGDGFGGLQFVGRGNLLGWTNGRLTYQSLSYEVAGGQIGGNLGSKVPLPGPAADAQADAVAGDLAGGYALAVSDQAADGQGGGWGRTYLAGVELTGGLNFGLGSGSEF